MWEGHRAVIYSRQCHRLAQWRTCPARCVFQVIVQSGRQPSVLQKLCQLPFQYFSHPRLIRVLFPSLISACYNNPQNKAILQQEMSCVLLATFIQVNTKTSCMYHAFHTITQFSDLLQLEASSEAPKIGMVYVLFLREYAKCIYMKEKKTRSLALGFSC